MEPATALQPEAVEPILKAHLEFPKQGYAAEDRGGQPYVLQGDGTFDVWKVQDAVIGLDAQVDDRGSCADNCPKDLESLRVV